MNASSIAAAINALVAQGYTVEKARATVAAQYGISTAQMDQILSGKQLDQSVTDKAASLQAEVARTQTSDQGAADGRFTIDGTNYTVGPDGTIYKDGPDGGRNSIYRPDGSHVYDFEATGKDGRDYQYYNTDGSKAHYIGNQPSALMNLGPAAPLLALSAAGFLGGAGALGAEALGPEYFMADGAFVPGAEQFVNPSFLGGDFGASGAFNPDGSSGIIDYAEGGGSLPGEVAPAAAGAASGSLGAGAFGQAAGFGNPAVTSAIGSGVGTSAAATGIQSFLPGTAAIGAGVGTSAAAAGTGSVLGSAGVGAAGTITGSVVGDKLLGTAATAGLASAVGSSSSSATIDPALRDMIVRNNTRANAVADNLGVRQFADFNDTQKAALGNLATINSNDGMVMARQAMDKLRDFNATSQNITPQQAALMGLGDARTTGFNAQTPMISAQQAALANPQSVQGYGVVNANTGNLGNAAMMNAAQVNRGDIRNINAGSFLQGDINAYMNPYTSAVIDRAAQDNERARQLAQQNIQAQAVGRGAYGGSRQAIAEAENTKNFLDTQARTASNLRAQGFDSAANLMQADLNRSMQAQGANQGMDQAAAFQNAGFNQQANASNQAAQNQFALSRYGAENAMNQFNAGNQTQANAFLAGAMNTADMNRFNAQNSMNQFNAGQANSVAAQNAGNFLNAQGMNLSARQFDVGQQNSFDLARFNAGNSMSQFNAGQANGVAATNASNNLQRQGLNLNASNAFLAGGLNLNNAYLNNAQAMFGAGAQMQQLEQNRMDAVRNNPLEQQQIRNAALGLASPAAFQQPAQPNGFGRALGLGALGLAAYNTPGLGNAVSSGWNWLSGKFGG